jgi:hypothetical protein
VSNRAGTSKWVTPRDSNFGEETIGYLQEYLSDVESEGECTIESDQNTECAEAEWQNQEVYLLQVFHSDILIVSSCVTLEDDMNYQNLPLSPNF